MYLASLLGGTVRAVVIAILPALQALVCTSKNLFSRVAQVLYQIDYSIKLLTLEELAYEFLLGHPTLRMAQRHTEYVQTNHALRYYEEMGPGLEERG